MRISQQTERIVLNSAHAGDVEGVAIPFNVADPNYAGGVITHSTVTSNTRLTIKADLELELRASIRVTSATVQSHPYLKYRINGTFYLPETSNFGYMRNTSGNDGEGLNIYAEAELTTDDYVELMLLQNGASGAVYLVANEAVLRARRL